MADKFKGQSTKRNDPAVSWFTITPGASALANRPRKLYCAVAGNATMEGSDGTSVAFNGLLAGQVYDLSPVKVTAATATLIGLI